MGAWMHTRDVLRVIGAWLLLLACPAPAFCQAPQPTSDQIRRELVMSAAQIESFRDAIQGLMAGRLQIDRANTARFLLRSNSENASVEIRPTTARIILQGSPTLVTEVLSLATAFATQPAGQLRILPLSDNAQASLARASILKPVNVATNSPLFEAGLPSFLGARRVWLTGAQQDAPATETETAESEDTPPAGLPLQQFEGVQVEMLPEIDAIILRGRDQQLQDLAEIIKRLDDASRLAQPEIEVIPLEHIQADSLVEVIEATQEDLLGARQGRATVTALSKPNAVLMIGWGEAIEVIKELISKLDRPVAADTQLDVIQLKYAIASEVQTQLQSFFQNRGDLGPVIQSTVDTRSNAIIVHAAPRDLQEIRLLIERIDVPRAAAMQQARVFEIRNSLAADVAETLQQALSGSTTAGVNSGVQLLDREGHLLATSGILGKSQITVNQRNNSLLVASAPENLLLIERLIEQLDTPGMVAKIKIFPIYDGDAGAMVETLRSLIPSQTAGSPAGPQLSTAPNETSLVALRFTVDARGNNVIAVGSEGDLKIVEALIVRLDESDTMQRKSTVYQLKNSPAVDVALAINEFLRNKRQVESASPGSTNPFEQLEKEVVVVPEPVQNKLILSATPRYYDEVSRLIEQLDEQPPQVMIQVLIAEITLGDTDEFGVEVGLQNSVLFDRSLLGDLLTRTNTTNTSTPAGVVTQTVQEIVAASNVPGFNFNSTDPLGNSGSAASQASSGQVGSQGISNFSVGRTNDTAGFGGLVLSASSENVSFLLRALQDSRRLEILSRPQVLTLDNQQAFIQVGQRVPRIVNSIINQNGAQNNVELENVGLIIGVTPRISPIGNVVMEIDAEKSKLGPENEGIPVSISANGTVIRSPRVDTITAQATVSAADGETIILGGLIARSTQTIHRQVPWLGDIPIVKRFFSYDYSEMQRTELLIIMTPHVIRSQGDMERLKQAEFARMSWCEADIFDMHGDVYPSVDMSTEMIDRGEWQTVYPDVDPRGRPMPPIREAIPYTDPSSNRPDDGFDSLPFPSPPPSSLQPSSLQPARPASGIQLQAGTVQTAQALMPVDGMSSVARAPRVEQKQQGIPTVPASYLSWEGEVSSATALQPSPTTSGSLITPLDSRPGFPLPQANSGLRR
jgi:general secretion pathway protein D